MLVVVVVAPFVIEVVSCGIMIFRVLSADHCSFVLITPNGALRSKFAMPQGSTNAGSFFPVITCFRRNVFSDFPAPLVRNHLFLFH